MLQHVKTSKKSISKLHFPVKLYEIYEKKLSHKIIFYMKIYKFELQHFFIRCIFFFLIQKNTIENPKFNFFNNNMCNTKKRKNAKLFVLKRSTIFVSHSF